MLGQQEFLEVLPSYPRDNIQIPKDASGKMYKPITWRMVSVVLLILRNFPTVDTVLCIGLHKDPGTLSYILGRLGNNITL